MMPLLVAPQGEPQIIKRVGGRDEMKKHLNDLGFVPGGEITVVSDLNGNLIVNVKDARVAINKELAGKIFVQQEGEKTMKTLKQVKVGETAKVVKLHGE